MGKASSQLRRWEEAQARYKLSLQLLRQLQTNDPQVRWIYLDMAEASQQQGRHQDSAMALDAAEKAHKALYSHATTSLDIVDQQGDFGTALLFASARTGWALLEANSDRAPTAARQAFQRLNYLDNGTVSTAVAQMAVRFATDNSTLGRLVRERQDLTSELLSIDRMLVSSLSGEASDISSQGRRELIERQEQLAKAVPQLEAKLKEQFPAYTELASPSPMTIAEVQSLLDEDEALVVQLVTSSETFVWGVTKNSDKWVRQNLGAAKVSEIVARLRGALDPSTAGQAAFDLSDAHKLYNELLKPLEPLIESKRHLLIVGNGALSSLPYQLLITGSPQTPVPSNVGDYASAEWLIKRHAVTTLPSVGSLRALRLFAKTQTAGKPFVGFGDPDFGSEKKVQAPEATRQVRSVASLVPAKAFRGALADVAALRESLIRLPDTANEIKSVASSVGAHEADLRLGQQATEASVKKMALGDYRIIYFATHGLVAGEAADLGGAAEPALALTVPAVATALDDGLLTASEVAGLKLNADWVVLSGCNTAAAGKPGAEALSGLARAFFYAGARSLLVSHWPVYSQAAVRLTTDTFRRLASEPGIGRAEALRLAMLDLMRDTTTPTNAYPAVWAPFSLVGEGLKRN
jgi:CHAT domain-containing protein